MKLYPTSLWAASLALATVVSLLSPARAEDPAPKKDPAPHSGNADQKPPTERSSEAMRARRDAAMAELGLSDVQRDKLRVAQKEQAEKARAIQEDANLTREQKSAKRRELRESFASTAKTILTPEQYVKWEKMQESRRQRVGAPVQPGQPSAPAPAPAPAAAK